MVSRLPTDPGVDTLIARAKAGDQAAFDGLFERFWPAVYRYFAYRVEDAASAEDLAAEVFLRVAHGLAAYEQQGAPFQAWVLRIARNLAIDHFRRTSTRPEVALDEEWPASPDDDLNLIVDRRLTGERLREALERLTDEQREVIILRFIVGCPIAEVVAALSRSESAVKALQRRGLAALRAALIEMKVPYDGSG